MRGWSQEVLPIDSVHGDCPGKYFVRKVGEQHLQI